MNHSSSKLHILLVRTYTKPLAVPGKHDACHVSLLVCIPTVWARAHTSECIGWVRRVYIDVYSVECQCDIQSCQSSRKDHIYCPNQSSSRCPWTCYRYTPSTLIICLLAAIFISAFLVLGRNRNDDTIKKLVNLKQPQLPQWSRSTLHARTNPPTPFTGNADKIRSQTLPQRKPCLQEPCLPYNTS